VCFCREPRGFGFVQYLDPADAADAQFRMDRQTIAGREITVVFAEDNRKKPSEMRVMERSRWWELNDVFSIVRLFQEPLDNLKRSFSLFMSRSPYDQMETSHDTWAGLCVITDHRETFLWIMEDILFSILSKGSKNSLLLLEALLLVNLELCHVHVWEHCNAS